MPTECTPNAMVFASVDRRRVEASFDGGEITSDAGAVLLGSTDRAIRLVDRFASCFTDARIPELIEYRVVTLVGQRVFGIALGGACPRAGRRPDPWATDDPVHGHQEGRFCYLPLYIFCGRHLLAARLRRSNIDGAAGPVEEVARIVVQVRARWPRVRVLLRADGGFCREALMAW